MNCFKIIICALLFFIVCCKNQTSQTSSSVSASTTDSELVDVDAFSKLISPENQLIDVRTPEEFTAGYIADARNINYRDSDFEKQIMTLNKEKPVLVYCKSGGRSAKSAAIFKQNGFAKVYDLKGGFMAWAKAQKPVSN